MTPAFKLFLAGLAVALAGFCAAARACPPGDHWGDAHVKEHFVGEAFLGYSAGLFIDNPYAAWGVAMLPGVYREEWKRHHGYSCWHPSRIVADTAGAALGVWVGRCLIRGRSVTCSIELDGK